MLLKPRRINPKRCAVALCLILLGSLLSLSVQPLKAEDPFANVVRTNLPLNPIDKEYYDDANMLDESQGVYFLPDIVIPEECHDYIMFACRFPSGCPDTPCDHKSEPERHNFGVSMFRFPTLYFPNHTTADGSEVWRLSKNMPQDDIRQYQCIQPATWYDNGPFDLEPLADHIGRYMHEHNPRQSGNMFDNANDLVRTRYLFNLLMREEATVSSLVTAEEKQHIFTWRGEHSLPQIFVWEFLMGEEPVEIWDYNANEGDYLQPYLKVKRHVEKISEAHKNYPVPEFTGNTKQSFTDLPEGQEFLVYQAKDPLSLEAYRLALTMAPNQFYKVPNAPLSIAFTDKDQLLVREEEGFDGDPITLHFSTSVLEHDLLTPKKDRVNIPKVLVSSHHQDKFEVGRIPTTHSFSVTALRTPPPPTEPEPTEPEPTEPAPTEPEPTEPEVTEPEPTEPEPTEPEPTKPEPTEAPERQSYRLKLIKEYEDVPASLEAKRTLAKETLIGLYYLGEEKEVLAKEAKGIVVERQKVKIACPVWNDDYSEAAIDFTLYHSGVYELVELKAPEGYQRSEAHHRLTIDLATQNFSQGFEARVRLPNPTIPPEATTIATTTEATCPPTTCPSECPTSQPKVTTTTPTKVPATTYALTTPTLKSGGPRIANIPASPTPSRQGGASMVYTTPIPATGEARLSLYLSGVATFALALIAWAVKRRI